jgi:hypothetical protein
MQIKPGDIIKSSRWDEPIEIILAEPLNGYARLVAVTVNSSDWCNVTI